jgi:hypothetical protein
LEETKLNYVEKRLTVFLCEAFLTVCLYNANCQQTNGHDGGGICDVCVDDVKSVPLRKKYRENTYNILGNGIDV